MSSSDDEPETNTVSIGTNTITFVFDCPSTHKLNESCKMTINVEEKIYKHDKGEPHVYYIDYFYEFIDVNGYIKKNTISYKHPCCPFYKFKDAENHYEGDIVYKNDMIEKMVNYLLMPFDEIKKYSGTTCPKEFKKQVIQSISLFWS